MITRVLLFVILSVAVFAAACSSGTTTTPANSASGNPSGSQTAEPLAGQANSNSQQGTVASVPVAPEAPGPVSGPLTGPPRKPLVDSNPNGPIPEPQRVPASENSEMSTTMDKAGNFVETRYFKTDPMLVKVQRTWLGPGKSTLKIWLKNGKEVTASGDKIENLSIAPIPSLLALAGVKTVPGSTGAK